MTYPPATSLSYTLSLHDALPIYRLLLRRQTLTRSPGQTGPPAAALGAVRGRPVRRPRQLTRPRLLGGHPRPPGRQPGHPGHGPQDRPVVASPAAGARPGRLRTAALTRTRRAASRP